MSRAAFALQSLLRGARQAVVEGSEAFGGAARFLHKENVGRYSPKQFSKDVPLDRSAGWYSKNPFIESWVFRRDKYEREFSWTLRNTFEAGYVVVGMTIALFMFSEWTIRQSDARNHYPARNMIFSETKTGFVLPDERDWH